MMEYSLKPSWFLPWNYWWRNSRRIIQNKDLSSYATTTEHETAFITHQAEDNLQLQEKITEYSAKGLGTKAWDCWDCRDINDIGGASYLSWDERYLLHDIMELNDNRILYWWRIIPGSPEAMFKANWFLNYGESYMTKEQMAIGKRQVSKARKRRICKPQMVCQETR
jgi:hypothetical protein